MLVDLLRGHGSPVLAPLVTDSSIHASTRIRHLRGISALPQMRRYFGPI